MLKNRDATLRRTACEGLAFQCEPGDDEVLLKVLADVDEDQMVRVAAARALVCLKHRRGIERIIALIERPQSDDEAKPFAERLMGCIAQSDDDVALDRLFLWLRQKQHAYLAGVSLQYVCSPRATDRLIDTLRETKLFEYVHTSEKACLALSRMKDPRTIIPLTRIFRDSHLPQVNRYLALRTLAQFDDPRIMPLLVEATQDQDPRIQREAVVILGNKRESSGTVPLLALLRKTRDPSLRAKVESALALIRESQAQ
jgi:HEAT repeat protein